MEDSRKLYLSFSGRNHGNCEAIARYLINKIDTYVSFKDLSYHSCSKCDYECFKNKCKYRDDDIYSLLESFDNYQKIIFLVPMYCGNPSSLYFIITERMQDYFNHNEEKYATFLKKLFIIGIFGSKEATPTFIPVLSSWFEKEDVKTHILGIERHLYHQKMNDDILANAEIKARLNEFLNTIIK